MIYLKIFFNFWIILCITLKVMHYVNKTWRTFAKRISNFVSKCENFPLNLGVVHKTIFILQKHTELSYKC